METSYFYIEKINKYVLPENTIDSFFIENIKTKNNESEPIMFYGKYYPININIQYVHFLVDGIGGYLEFKKHVPEIKPIFIITNKDMGNPNLKANFEALKIINAPVIDITKENVWFESFFIPQGYPFVISIQDLKNIFKSIDNNFKDCGENELWFYNCSKQVIDLLNKNYLSLEKNIYVSRSKINKKYILNNKWLGRVHDARYDEKLDNMMHSIGYEVVFAEDLGLFEQINLFNNAKNIVSIGGASLFNGLWAHNNANIIQIKIMDNYEFFWKEIFEKFGKKMQTINFTNLSVNLDNLIKEINKKTIL